MQSIYTPAQSAQQHKHYDDDQHEAKYAAETVSATEVVEWRTAAPADATAEQYDEQDDDENQAHEGATGTGGLGSAISLRHRSHREPRHTP